MKILGRYDKFYNFLVPPPKKNLSYESDTSPHWWIKYSYPTPRGVSLQIRLICGITVTQLLFI